MKRLAAAAGLVLVMTMTSHAECRYFRVAYKLVSCGVSPSVPIDSTTAPETTLPGLEDDPIGASVTITCGCDYALQGSDPLCDLERTEEFTSTEGSDDPLAACRPGKTLCAVRCPKRLP